MFNVGDIVFVSNPNQEYEEEMGVREHKAFFCRITDIEEYGKETVVEVHFPNMPSGPAMDWTYNAEELSCASELKNLTLEEFSNRYGVSVLAEYIM